MQHRSAETSSFLYAVRPIAADLASTIFFYVILAVSGDASAAALAGIAFGFCQIAFMRARRLTIAPLQWASVTLVVLLGTLTALTNDPRFILVKVTIFYAVLGGTMLKPAWMDRYIPAIADGHLPRKLIRKFEFAWAGLMLGTGALNLLLSFTTDMLSVATTMTVGAIASKVALFSFQYCLFRAIARPSILASRDQDLA